MSKEDNIEVTGVILENFARSAWRTRPGSAGSSGQPVAPEPHSRAWGTADIELSPYDLTKGRITFRHR
jgi:hypothetical protein